VASADVVLDFWNGTTCHSLVHEHGHEQPKTTKELCDITSRHASGEEAIENSDEEFILQPRAISSDVPDHFEKIVEATYPNHRYPIKHKLRDYTMMKRFMPSAGTSPGGDELVGDPRGGGTTLRDAEVATITN
jgi:hypothetical protein